MWMDTCVRLYLNNRQYEEKQLRSQQERAKKRLEFSNQISRLQNQLQYEKQRKTQGGMHVHHTCTCKLVVSVPYIVQYLTDPTSRSDAFNMH